MKKKILSIIMVVMIVAITVVGITACTEDKSDKLVGTWISIAEDNEHYIGMETNEDREYVNYYAVITKSSEKDSKDYVLNSYMIYQTSGKYDENKDSKIVKKEEGKYFTLSSFSGALVAKSSHYINIKDDNTILIESENGSRKYTFRRTTMTLDEFKTQYGKETE